MISLSAFAARLRKLTRLDRARVELTLARIQNIAPIMFVFNMFLLGISMLARLKAYLRVVLSNLGVIRTGGHSRPLEIPDDMPSALVSTKPNVLLVVEDTIPQCFHYRVEQKLEQLQILGLDGHWVSWRDLVAARHALHFADIVIFYRVPAFQGVLDTIRYARALNKITVYDIDDLVFDRDELEKKFKGATGQLPAHERNSMLQGAELYLTALRECAFGIASTEALRVRLAAILGDERCFVLANGIGNAVRDVGSALRPPKLTQFCSIFYGSGTKTHDEDFALVAKPLTRVMQKYPEVRLVLVGHLSIPTDLEPFASRIEKLPPLEFEAFLAVLAIADVNIAPLEPGAFADCKSEIKWMEAAAFGVPSVVSRTATYEAVVTDGVTGLVADDEHNWYSKLDSLVDNHALRMSIGVRSNRECFSLYSSERLAERLQEILAAIVRKSEQDGTVACPDERPHLLFVNTLYPPQALGGATSVLTNIVRQIQTAYSDRFRISVVTYDLKRSVPYEVREYAWEGVPVTSISVLPSPDMDWIYKNQQIRDIFEDILDFRRPNLVHFHSVQRLTGSVLEACERKGVPFFVTVHDAWWLSDHQFLLDKAGNPVPDLQRNPLIAARSSAHIPGTLKRAQYLSARLQNAHRIFAVSAYQADLYRRNGFTKVTLNRNGVDAPLASARQSMSAQKLRLGYVGGICAHKGYLFLKKVISSVNAPELELTVVDFDLEHGRKRTERWGNVDVTFVPPFQYPDRGSFYESIHVLVAPSMWPESFGLVAREANLSGCWVVASCAGGLAEDIRPGENGHTFEVGNEGQLEAILLELARNPTRYMQLAPTTPNITTVAQQVAELVVHYQEVISDKNTRPSARELGRLSSPVDSPLTLQGKL